MVKYFHKRERIDSIGRSQVGLRGESQKSLERWLSTRSGLM